MEKYLGDINMGRGYHPAPGWVEFWFEGNQAWGMVSNPEDWALIKKAYPRIYGEALESVNYGAAISKPYYGFRMECRGPKTLKEFFEENGMEIRQKGESK